MQEQMPSSPNMDQAHNDLRERTKGITTGDATRDARALASIKLQALESLKKLPEQYATGMLTVTGIEHEAGSLVGYLKGEWLAGSVNMPFEAFQGYVDSIVAEHAASATEWQAQVAEDAEQAKADAANLLQQEETIFETWDTEVNG